MLVKIPDAEYFIRIEGQGPPLLLVHGFPLDHTMWRKQIDELRADFRLIAPDLRGFGRSSAAEGVITMQQIADDLAELLAAIGVNEPVNFCGLSMGGYVAWQFWSRHREMLSRLILCDTRAAADSEVAARGRRQSAQQVLKEGTSDLVGRMAEKLFSDLSLREQPEIVESTREVMWKAPAASVSAALLGMAEREDYTSRLGEVELPTLLICGEHDAITPPEEMRSVAAALPDAEFVLVPAAGHMSPLEQPGEVNAAIRRFLGRTPRR